jgi:RND family efflux transporter MFP subunit
MQPETQSVQHYDDFSGRVAALEHVEVKSRVTGFLVKVHYQDGEEVRQGDLLYTIDSRESEAELEAAAAAFQRTQAQAVQARSDHARSRQLGRQRVITTQETEKQATSVLAAEAALRAAQARLDKAKLYHDWTEIRAPISGQVSRAKVTEGNLVTMGEALTSIVSQDPVCVYFDVPERVVLRWDAISKEVAATGLVPRAKAAIGVLDEEGFPREGRVDFADNKLGSGTGALSMRAVVSNKDRSLRVGLFARVRVTLDQSRETLLLPERVVGILRGRRFVYVINHENTVEYREVSTGQVFDGKLAIVDGLKRDDRVVTEGLQSLRPGQAVRPEPSVREEQRSSARSVPVARRPAES